MKILVEKVVDEVMIHITLPPKYSMRFIRGEEYSGVPLIIMLEHDEQTFTMCGGDLFDEEDEVKNDL
jgi:hypothetical protein